MGPEDRATKAEKRRRRRRKIETIGYVIALPMVLAHCALFVRIALVGYLSRIAVMAGIVYFAPLILLLAIGLMGNRPLAKCLGYVWMCLLVAGLLAWGALAFWPRGHGPWRRYSFDAELAALEAERTVPEEENAARRYDAVLATVDVDGQPALDADRTYVVRRLSQEPWEAEDQPEISAWLDAHASVVAQLLRIGQMEHCRWPIYAKYDCKWPVPYPKMRFAAQLLSLAGNRHLGEGRLEEARDTYRALLRQGDHLRQQTDMLDFQFSFGPEEAALVMIRYVLVHGDLAAEDISDITQHLPGTANDWQRDVQRLMDFEEYRFVNYLARAYEINEQGQIRFTRSLPIPVEEEEDDRKPTWRERLCPLDYCLTLPLDPQNLWPLARDELSEMRRFVEPGPLLPKESHALDSGGMFSASTIRLGSNPLRFAARFLSFDTYMYASWGERYAENLTHRRGTWLVLGLRRYRDEHGTWPQSLESVSEYVPSNAFLDPISGSHFVYIRGADTFKLYSTGLNHLDEDGRTDYAEALGRFQDDIPIWPLPVPEPPSGEPDEEMLKQLREIYGERFIKHLQADANDQ